MGVFPDLEVGEKLKSSSRGWQFIVAGEGDGNVVSNAMHVQNHMSGIRLGQDSFQKGDHACKDLTRLTRRQALRRILMGLPLIAPAHGLLAVDPDWRIWLEGRFMAPQVHSPVEGAKRSLLCAGRWDGTQLVSFTRLQWLELGMSWVQLENSTKRASAQDLAQCSVSFKRDKRQVIEYAEVRCELPLVASAVLAPEFATRFSETLGDVIQLAVPNRHKAFVFPQLGSDLSRYSDLVLNAYRDGAYPVSVELFELRNGILRCAGIFERPH